MRFTPTHMYARATVINTATRGIPTQDMSVAYSQKNAY